MLEKAQLFEAEAALRSDRGDTAQALAAIDRAYVVAVEEFPLDRMLDEAGRALKDVSHVGSRWLELGEIEALMLVPGEVLGTIQGGALAGEIPGITARLSFARLDRDRSGLLEGEELEGPLARLDSDRDGRLALIELEDLAVPSPPPTPEFEGELVGRAPASDSGSRAQNQPSAVLGRISLVRKSGADARRLELLAKLLAFY